MCTLFGRPRAMPAVRAAPLTTVALLLCVLALTAAVAPAARAVAPVAGASEPIVVDDLPVLGAARTDRTTASAGGAGADGPDGPDGPEISDVVALPAASAVAVDAPPGALVEVRTAAATGALADGPFLELELEAPLADGRLASEPLLLVEPATAAQVRVTGAALADVTLHATPAAATRDPAAPPATGVGAMPGASAFRSATTAAATVEVAPGVSIITRAGWGADESWRSGRTSYADGIDGITIHHTATANGYSAAQAPAAIRSMYHFHTKTRGWSDIGYNYLIDAYGRIYEGRAGGTGQPVIGAHAGGFNTATAGISFIGTYAAAAPSRAAQDAAVRLVAWIAGRYNLDTTGTVRLTSRGSTRYAAGTTVTLPVVFGHTSVSATSCPGRATLGWLPTLRSRARAATPSYMVPFGPLLPGLRAASRLAGPERFSTAAAISTVLHRGRYATGRGPVVYVASGEAFPDALAAGPAAHARGAPLLLSGRSVVHAPLTRELARLQPRRIVLVGGEAAIGADVARRLAAHGPVIRLQGASRFATAAAVARDAFTAPVRRVCIASGSAFPDALAAGPVCGGPLLLTGRDALPEETVAALRALRPAEVAVVGGEGVVSDRVEQQLAGHADRVVRWAGSDRFATAARVVAATVGRADTVVVASGLNYPDALAGAPLAAAHGAPLLLTAGARLHPRTRAQVVRLDPEQVYVLGSRGVVADGVAAELRARR